VARNVDFPDVRELWRKDRELFSIRAAGDLAGEVRHRVLHRLQNVSKMPNVLGADLKRAYQVTVAGSAATSGNPRF